MQRRQIMLAAAVAIFAVAAFLVYRSARTPEVPRAKDAAVVVTPSGFRQDVTWGEVFSAASRGASEAYLDQNPGGGWMFKASNGEFGRVINPGDPDPKFRPAPAQAM